MGTVDVWLARGLIGFGLMTGLVGSPAAAQDWSLTRPDRSAPSRSNSARSNSPRSRPRQPRPGRSSRPGEPGTSTPSTRSEVLIERYLGILERNPAEGFAFQRLLDVYRERDGNLDALLRRLEERATSAPDAFVPRMLLGHVHRTRGDIPAASARYREAAALRPAAVQPVLALARVARAAGDLADARARFETALERIRDATERQEVYRTLGEIAVEQSDFDAARRFYDGLAGAGDSAYLRTEYARMLMSRGHPEQAIDEYERVLRSLQGDRRILPPLLHELARAQLEAGQTSDAIETLERALRVAGRRAGIRAEIHDTMVEAYRRTNRLPELVARLEREGHSFETLSRLGHLQDELGNVEEALSAYRGALGRNRRDLDVRRAIIQLLLRSGRIEDVIREYRSLIGQAPREPSFVVELARMLMQVGRRDEALRETRRISRRFAREPAVHRALAHLYARSGEEELAAQEVAILARIQPDDPAHLIALGAQQLEAGDRQGAMQTWRRILTVEPDRGQAHATLGAVLSDHDLLREASEQYQEAVRLDPNSLDFARGLANVYERLRQDASAVESWQRVLSLAAEDRTARREARQRIVGIWQRSNRLQHQIAELRARFDGETPDAEAGRFLAEAYRRLGPSRVGEAEAALERVIAIDRGDVESLVALERLKAGRGDLAGAIEVLKRLVEADARRAPQHLQRMAEHALALYRDEDAVRYAAEAARRTPNDANGHRRLGDLYRARQDATRAVASYRRALELNERLYPTYFDLAELLIASGDLDEADALYRRVIGRSPDDDLVARAARASLQIHLGDGSLEILERDLLPLSLSNPERPIFRKLVVELYDALTAPLIQAVRRGGDAAEQAEIALRAIGGRAIKPLLEALADADAAQRQLAVGLLGYVGNPNAAAPLLAVAESDEEMALRLQALAAAGAVGGDGAAPRLAALAEGPERRLRGMAAWALGRVGGPEAGRSLRGLLARGDSTVRAFAALGLGATRDQSSGDALEALVTGDRSAHVQVAAAWALGLLGDVDRVAPLGASLTRATGGVATTSAAALGLLGDTAATPALARASLDPDPALRAMASLALRRLAQPAAQAVRTLPIPGLPPSPLRYVRQLVAAWREAPPVGTPSRSLDQLNEAFRDAAREALRGPTERVWAALDVLGENGIPWAGGDASGRSANASLLPELCSVAEHPDAALRTAVLPLLGRIDDPTAHEVMVAALSDPEPSVQREALASLPASAAMASDAVAALLSGHAAWSIRTLAAEALGRLQRGTPALAEALASDPYAFVRQAAAAALGRQEASPALFTALEDGVAADPANEVREAAARALLGFGAEGRASLGRAVARGGRRARQAAERAGGPPR